MRKAIIHLLLVALMCAPASAAAVFEEHVTDPNTYDNNWTEAGVGWTAWPEDIYCHSAENSALFATDLVLPDSFTASAYIGDRINVAGGGWDSRPGLFFNCQAMDGQDGVPGYGVSVYYGDIYLGVMTYGGTTAGIDSISDPGVGDYSDGFLGNAWDFHDWKLEVRATPTSNQFRLWIDGQLQTWDSGTTVAEIAGELAGYLYHGGTIGLKAGPWDETRFDDIIVEDTIREGRTVYFLETVPFIDKNQAGSVNSALEANWIIHPTGWDNAPGAYNGTFQFYNSGWGEQAAYADDLSLPQSYVFEFDLSAVTTGQGRGPRACAIFCAQETGAYLPSNCYFVSVYDHETPVPDDGYPRLTLYKITDGSTTELGYIEDTNVTDYARHTWQVHVTRVGTDNQIQLYIDGSPITWTHGAEAGNSVVVDGDHTGGTIGFYGQHERAFYVDNVAVFEKRCGDVGTQPFLSADLNQDCYVNWGDFTIFAGQWLQCTDPANPACN